MTFGEQFDDLEEGQSVVFHDRSARYGGAITVVGTITTVGDDYVLIKNNRYTLKRQPGYWRARLSTDSDKYFAFTETVEDENGECETCKGVCLGKTFNYSKKETTMDVLGKIKNIALQATNPSEYALRKAGFHNDCGDLTSVGQAVLIGIVEAANLDALVAQANAVIAADKADKE